MTLQPTSWSHAGQYLRKASFFFAQLPTFGRQDWEKVVWSPEGSCSPPHSVLVLPVVLSVGHEAWWISPCGGSCLGWLCLWPVRSCWVPGRDCGARLGMCLLAGIAQLWYPASSSASLWCSCPAGILARPPTFVEHVGLQSRRGATVTGEL